MTIEEAACEWGDSVSDVWWESDGGGDTSEEGYVTEREMLGWDPE